MIQDVDRVIDGGGHDNDNMTMKRPSWRKRMPWWSNVLSRVSRSASSLLNQHSANLNDLLEEGGGQSPIAAVEESEGGEAAATAALAEIDRLKETIRRLEVEKEQFKSMQCRCSCCRDERNESTEAQFTSSTSHPSIQDIPTLTPIQTLHPHQITRYSRQLLLSDGFGLIGQRRLLGSSILVVGAGGIGSSLLLYLAASGVGHVTIVDYDGVERSNLHRQIIHRDKDSSCTSGDDIGRHEHVVGRNKAHSAKAAMLALNPTISITALDIMIDGSNIMELVSRHDVVVDASDNPRTRYLLNDACILADLPLVSGSAMGTEGQLTVYNYRSSDVVQAGDSHRRRGGCYRCLYPDPNPADGCKSCSDNGVLGPVPGLIGVLQAVEVIKIITGIGNVMNDRLLMYDSLSCTFINIKKPPPKQNCAICSSQATIKNINDSEQSLHKARGPAICALPTNQSSPLSNGQHISCKDYDKVRKAGHPHILLDVRLTRQYEMCSLDGSINIPLEELESKLDTIEELSDDTLPVYCLCRRGVASMEATRILQRSIEEGKCKRIHSVYNVDGGLNSWVQTVDPEFPWY